ncbi:hypothetical protein N7478_009577 [Penicillium angulare]|uniref:uncharacterized protein n=1 Tax=Penicillium angulare TaxID=116970 RepID=UPI0025402858|nr:uncharacterized protein N7478_009577 [Penicillium angulare]KAJ5266769.1 hypothetical protein N7478_009577 [Penicillium angulare]
MFSMNVILTLSVPLLTAIGYGLYCGYQHRRKINELRKQGVAMPKWNWITGHLLILGKYLDPLPSNAFVQLAMQDLSLEWGETEVFLMDVWPIFPAYYVVYDPQTAVQVSTKLNLPKTSNHLKFMKPIVGGPNIHSMIGSEWKSWRSIFNPGFSANSMTDLMPAVIDSVQVFSDILRENVGSGIIKLDELSTRLTMEVILKVTLDMDSGHQRSEHEISRALKRITAWHSFWDPRVLANPIRPFIQKYYGSVMNRIIQKELHQRFQEIKENNSNEKPLEKSSKRAKSVITLALEAYLADPLFNKNGISTDTLDDHFASYASYQIRLFLFAGNDTTSSSILYVYHMLFKHPEIVTKVKEEHDRIFGTDPSAAADLLKNDPSLLNQCLLTVAVIKETLRMFSPASTNRGGQEGSHLTDRHGNVYPTDYVGASILHQAAHYNPRVWPRVNEFLPERWLVDKDHELYPDPSAWRPFEQGPRNCIGQTLVYNEMRLVLVMTLRTFKIEPAYDEWDVIQRQKEGSLTKWGRWAGVVKDEIKTVHGERAYQTEEAGGHPADGYPCRISLAS